MATFIGRSEAAKILGCSEKTINNWAKKKIIKPVLVMNGKMKFSREDLESIVKKGGDLNNKK